MGIGISYAGVPLCLEDPGGAVQSWLDQWLPLDDLRALTKWQLSPWRSWSVPSPNYPHQIETKINTWYRPVGAARWSFGFFLATAQQKESIRAAVTSGGGSAGSSLQFENDDGTGGGWKAWMLPPRPISAQAGSTTGLWLIPLVDERYYWQFMNAKGLLVAEPPSPGAITSWGGLFSSLATALGITLHYDTVNANYGYPDPTNWNEGSWSNPATMLDAAAWCVGQRVVLEYLPAGPGAYFSGVYRSCNWTTSTARKSQNFSQQSRGAVQAGVLAGNVVHLAGQTPEAVQVVFRRWANGITIQGAYAVTVPASGLAQYGWTSGVTQSIQTSAYADFTSLGPNPDNKATCDALAQQIATDFYRSISWQYDFNYVGIQPWIETGFEDYVEFSVGRRRDGGAYECKTRIHGLPYNLGVQSMLHWLPNTHDYPDTIEGKLDGPLSANGIATLSVYDGPGVSDVGRNVVVRDRLYWSAPAGAWCVAEKIGEEWRPVALSCDAVP
jgi:hypothetical protein